jgi:hypothetical protein
LQVKSVPALAAFTAGGLDAAGIAIEIAYAVNSNYQQ